MPGRQVRRVRLFPSMALWHRRRPPLGIDWVAAIEVLDTNPSRISEIRGMAVAEMPAVNSRSAFRGEAEAAMTAWDDKPASAPEEGLLRDVLRQVPQWRNSELVCERVSGGISNSNWRVAIIDQQRNVFVKIPGKGT